MAKKKYDQMCYFEEKNDKVSYGINDFIDDFYGNFKLIIKEKVMS